MKARALDSLTFLQQLKALGWNLNAAVDAYVSLHHFIAIASALLLGNLFAVELIALYFLGMDSGSFLEPI